MTALRIAIIGERGAGKDEAAAYFAQHGCVRGSIAEPMKRGQEAALDAAVRYAETHPEFAAAVPVLRRLRDHKGARRAMMQEEGLAMRRVDQSILTRSLIVRLRLAEAQGRVVVTDTRYPDEAEALRTCGFKIVRIVAEESLRRARSEARGDGEWIQEDSNHISETALALIPHDYLVENNGSIEGLHAHLEAVVNDIVASIDTDYVHA